MKNKIALEFIENTSLNELNIKNYGFNIARFRETFTKPSFKCYPESKKVLLKNPLMASSLSKLIRRRRSCRNFSGNIISLKRFSELILSSYQILFEKGNIYYSLVPSAGALQSLELYVLPFNITGLNSGIYHYNKLEKSLELLSENKIEPGELDKFILTEGIIEKCNALFIITSLTKQVFDKYQDRGLQFIYAECGYLQQNISLVAEEMGLKSLIIGGFFEQRIKEMLEIKSGEEIIGVMLIGC